MKLFSLCHADYCIKLLKNFSSSNTFLLHIHVSTTMGEILHLITLYITGLHPYEFIFRFEEGDSPKKKHKKKKDKKHVMELYSDEELLEPKQKKSKMKGLKGKHSQDTKPRLSFQSEEEYEDELAAKREKERKRSWSRSPSRSRSPPSR